MSKMKKRKQGRKAELWRDEAADINGEVIFTLCARSARPQEQIILLIQSSASIIIFICVIF